MNVTIHQRAQVAMDGHSYAVAQFRAAMAAGNATAAWLWDETRRACMDELDECAHALALGIEPQPSEILKGNADIHAP